MKHALILVVETEQTDREVVKDAIELIIGGSWITAGPFDERVYLTIKPEPDVMREAIAPLIEATKRMREEDE